MVLKICISDGESVIVDGFDKITFYNELPIPEVVKSGYSWRKDSFFDLLNGLAKYRFIEIKRHDNKDNLEYQNHSFAFKNENFKENNPLILQTSCITTIIDMYN